MKNFLHAILTTRVHARFLILVVLLCLVSTVAPLSRASAPLTIRVINNSGWEIRHLYLSPANSDNWGSDQLSGSSINPGVTRTLNVSWDDSTIKLVGEDQDGCFLSTTVQASGEAEWTITGDAARNCGN